ncbi:MAG: AsmA family protein [Saprospiraceae bacterium]|nr:AsmA family protein [Saprospiraceae bacterium]
MTKRKNLKILLWALAVLVFITILAYNLLRIPSIQTFVVQKVTTSLSKQLGTTVQVDAVHLKFFKTASITGIYLEDAQNDTLFYARNINASIRLFHLFNKRLEIDELSIDGVSVNLDRAADTTAFNFQHIIDHFSTGSNSGSSPWAFKLDRIKINDGQLKINDRYTNREIQGDLGSFRIYLNDLDNPNKKIDINQIGLGDSHLTILQGQSKRPSISQAPSSSQEFPFLGWEIKVNQVRLEETDLRYRDLNHPQQAAFNPSDLELFNLALFLDDFHWSEKQLAGNLSNVSFSDKSGFILDDLVARVEAVDTSVLISKLKLITPVSVINNETTFSLSHFGHFASFSDSVRISSQFVDSEIDVQDLKLLAPGFSDIQYLNSELGSKIKVNGSLLGKINNLKFEKFDFKVGKLLSLKMGGNIKNLVSPLPFVVNVNVNRLSTSYSGLQKLTRNMNIPTGLANWGEFNFSGYLQGNLANITGRNVKFTTSSITRFEGDFSINGLPDIDHAVFDIDVADLRSVASDLQGFSEDKLPPAMDSLGQFYYSGNFRGTIYDFILDGTLASDAGSMKTDLSLQFEEDFKNARYSGDLLLKSFDLGKVLSRDDLEELSVDVNIFGSGLQPDVLRATVLGKVQELVYNGYHYHDLEIDGRFDKRQFAGHASIQDPNVDFDFEGVVDLNDSLARFRFNAAIDTINLTKLGFITPQLGFSGKIISDFRGKNADSMKGNILATNLSFSNLSEHFKLDSLLLLSDYTNQEERVLELKSDLVNGSIKGAFTLQQLPAFFLKSIDQYFPINADKVIADTSFTFNVDSISTDLTDQNFIFDWSMTDLDKILSLVDPKIEKLDTILLGGRVDQKNSRIDITGFVKKIEYDGMSFGPITLTSTGDEYSMDHVVSVSDAHIANGIDFPYLHLDLSMAQDSAFIGILLEDATDTVQEKLNLAALFTEDEGRYQINLNENMVLNGEDWTVSPEHFIQLNKGKVQIGKLSFNKGQQQIAISTRESEHEGVLTSTYDFSFGKFELREISEFLEFNDANYNGQVNGDLTLRSSGNKLNYLADLSLDDLTLNQEPLGKLIIKSDQRSDDLIELLVRLEGGISGLDVRGTYNLTNSAIDIQGEVDQLDMKSLDPFLKKYIAGSTGKLSGIIKASGTTTVPVIDGFFELEKVSTVIDYLQARYTFANEEIRIEQNKLGFRDFKLVDQSGNPATINGHVDFKNLADPNLDFTFKTSRFLVLNTPPDSKEFFYGKLFVGGDVTASGTLLEPRLQVNAIALDSTDFVLQPLISEATFQQEDFIIFANPKQYTEDTSISLQDLYNLDRFDIDLAVNLECTPDARLTIVIDPATGDKLVCRGNGNLAIEITPDGDANIRGNYFITSGEYAFNFQRVIKRTFKIEPDSRVTFVGNILKSRFDISASYGVRTSTYELIKNQSTLSSTEEVQSRQRSDVQVKLKLTGDLAKPVAKFDVEIDEGSGAGSTSSVSTKLAQLREDESSMNKQVFGLLIFNSFIAEEQTTSASLLTDAGQSAILSSVSNLLSNELNRLAKRYIKGVDLDFGVNSYSNTFDDGNSLITELEVGLSKRLLNERLTVKVGGNVQFENTTVEVVNNQNSTFSGDFVLEYKLTPDGNYNLRFFQAVSNSENIFNPGVNYSETGVSVFFTRSFNSKKYQLQLDEQ